MKKILLAGLVLMQPLIAAAIPSTDTTFNLTIKVKYVAIQTTAYLAYQINGKKYIDSARLINNSYTFSGSVKRPLNASLLLDHKRIGIKTIISSKAINTDVVKFYLHPGKINMVCDSLIAEAKFTNSSINQDNYNLQKQLSEIFGKQLQTSRLLIVEKDPTKAKAMLARMDSLKLERIPILLNFIRKHPKSYISLTSLEEYFGYSGEVQRDAGTPLSASSPQTLFNDLVPELRASEAGVRLEKLLNHDKQIRKGSMAPGFSQPDVNGKLISLADFKGKYVLLDFWASWCGPCRVQNPKLVKLYERFKNQNFTILGISLDEQDGKDKWKKAIIDDKMTWPQVSDLRHWDSQVAALYGIRWVPDNFLVGPDGKIVARSLTPEALIEELEKIWSK